jgi:TldD protein
VKPAMLAVVLALAPAQPAGKGEAKTAAAASTAAAVKQPVTALDVEVAAIEQELARGISGLRLPDSPAPYLAQVQLVRASLFGLDASYGGVITDLVEEQAAAAVEVRVGDAKRDQGGMFGADGPQLRFIVSLEPSQALTRHKLWLALDQAFRAATATFSQKQAILARLAGDPPPPDMGPKPDPVPRQSITTPSNAGFDREALRGLVKSLSKRFADHPNVDNGDVLVQVLRTHLTTVTSEGVVLHEQRDRAVLVVVAEMRAPDGMQLDAGGAIHLQTVPRADDDLRVRGEQLVDRVLRELEEQAAAPMIEEDYDGPILFHATAAAQLLASTVATQAGGTPAPLGDAGRVRDFEPHWQDALGKSVMPAFIDLEDDPRDGFGRFVVDGQGFTPQPLTLVKGGVLKELLMTRTPNKWRAASNGRARVSPQLGVGPTISNLTVKTKTRGSTRAQLERDLLRRAREDGYDFAYVVEGLRDNNILGPVDREGATGYGGGRKVSLPLPARIFRIEASGKRTLVRGAMFSPASMRVLRRIRSVGNAPITVPMRIPPGYTGGFGAETGMDGILSHTVDVQVTSPDLLVDGLEVLVERSENERLPILAHPLRPGSVPAASASDDEDAE